MRRISPLLTLLMLTLIPFFSRRTMASFSAAASGTRCLVRLRSPGPFLSVKSRDAKASAKSSYQVIQEADASFDGLQVCVWVDSTAEGEDHPNRAGPFCFEGPQQDLPIDGLGLGSHRLSAVVVEHTDPSAGDAGKTLVSPVATTDFDVVFEGEFVPSYDWQLVRPWQSVPPGLEVELPLDGIKLKRARIPPAWRLQLYVPGEEGGGKYNGFFVRTDLRAEDTVLDLRQEIARQSRLALPLEYIALELDGRLLGDDETVEALDLFNRQKDIVPVMKQSSDEA